ncbi:MAG: hypothetical protein COT38_00560 [Candidatus Omnitrophica bacterium CG08_land_8_20_14_0_20_41_16]|uniref:PEGA domain-containing protein n=1 Tax=Candidatus Sherwoodlollariibacterium unditelluris TaxID=1974757 RepID=A0A2G9YK73_9BACT|nr:MAG: hypothetical protein COX41_01835 [Candidatus Omnitrophica bacterium CG23_combo_of_CG06-09_8_20_14_all_41_10]PIS34374.1 MAG: hypothetical protein COT38_00560 [Candidatus Omnitrophica bacterium CG08_land_8_20_14_0_20_41_16]
MLSEQRIRGVLFYLSVVIFFTGIPFILSFALGYKFNSHTFKFTKTGLISIKTQPPGARIYLGSKLLPEKTPATINELLPGVYDIRLELERYYSYGTQVQVEPRKVTRLEKVILFPTRPNIKQLNQGKIASFCVDKEKGSIYYLNQDENAIYESNLDGEEFKEISNLPMGFNYPPKELKVSFDREKILIFNNHQICVVYLNQKNNLPYYQPPLILNYPAQEIEHVFWHSDSCHLVLITDKNIAVLEATPKSNPTGIDLPAPLKEGSHQINLVNLNSKALGVFYEVNKDVLYFSDYERGADGIIYENIYKLELNSKPLY